MDNDKDKVLQCRICGDKDKKENLLFCCNCAIYLHKECSISSVIVNPHGIVFGKREVTRCPYCSRKIN